MRPVVYSMSMSLDGFIVGPDGGFDWSVPDQAVFQSSLDEVRGIGVHLLGRNLYESMVYWEDPSQHPEWEPIEHEFATVWNPIPKVVFSHSLSTVVGNARLASNDLATEIAQLQVESSPGEIAIGGATLAAQAMAMNLINEYRVRIYPALVGGGIPFFAHTEQHVDIDLIESQTFDSGIVYLRYGVAQEPR